MIEIFKKILSLIVEFFKWRSNSLKHKVYQDRKDEEKMKQRVKIRKQLRDIAKTGDIQDFFKIFVVISTIIILSGCHSITIHPKYEFENRYNTLPELKKAINDYNIDESFWIISAQTFEDIINQIENSYSKCN